MKDNRDDLPLPGNPQWHRTVKGESKTGTLTSSPRTLTDHHSSTTGTIELPSSGVQVKTPRSGTTGGRARSLEDSFVDDDCGLRSTRQTVFRGPRRFQRVQEGPELPPGPLPLDNDT